jgi:outer membrane protein assembly factor BamE (lipoprotein component of BamABCDE complex)
VKYPLLPIVVAAVVLSACAPVPTKPVTTRNSELTHGNVQLNLKVGETSQTQVLEVFGAPNITSVDGSGQEVWTYQRAATVAQSTSSSSGWTILLAGGSREAAGFEQTQRTMTLIIKFNDKKIVSDFRSRSSEF